MDGRARRYYRLTEDGTAALGREALRMQQAAAVVIGRSRRAGAAPASRRSTCTTGPGWCSARW
ncbi:hypothetical protein Shyhy02_38810 [Streptomyces hygroscopicus subsp. hygroscopicus]|nr:hypothetical protein Shyhy02_38810 [Streptomyces hygroscopicus subsp. hygroscopicus]